MTAREQILARESEAFRLVDALVDLDDGATALEELIAAMPARELGHLEYHWPFWRRPAQVPPPGDWRFLLALAGRGFGKTRMCSEAMRQDIEAGLVERGLLISKTDEDVEDVMVHGPAGLRTIAPPWFKPEVRTNGGTRRLEYPNGTQLYFATAQVAGSSRGKEIGRVWWDEVAESPKETIKAVWYNVRMALRESEDARGYLSTTAKKGCSVILELLADAKKDPGRVVVVRGSTTANTANPRSYTADLVAKYGGTRLGRAELEGDMLEDEEGSLFRQAQIDALRITRAALPELERVAIGCDPAVSTRKGNDETGIVAAGRDARGHCYVLEDASGNHSPDDRWRAAIGAYLRNKAAGRPCADVLVVETNKGGDLPAQALKYTWAKMLAAGEIAAGAHLNILEVFSRVDKEQRADPVSAMYERGEVHHVGDFDELEHQQTTWIPTLDAKSPDRLDGAVFALWELGGRLDPRRAFRGLAKANEDAPPAGRHEATREGVDHAGGAFSSVGGTEGFGGGGREI